MFTVGPEVASGVLVGPFQGTGSVVTGVFSGVRSAALTTKKPPGIPGASFWLEQGASLPAETAEQGEDALEEVEECLDHGVTPFGFVSRSRNDSRGDHRLDMLTRGTGFCQVNNGNRGSRWSGQASEIEKSGDEVEDLLQDVGHVFSP